jgi:NAD(P)-dependent dehydrogenase (short-subunit alcohol dehydrogenase family)
MSLDGRVALITGATGPAGRAVASDLAGAGVRVALIGTNLNRLEAMATELGIAGDRCLLRAVDLREASAAASAVDEVVSRFGRLDIVAHLVGGWTGGHSLVDTPRAEFTSMLDQHVATTVNVLQAAVPRLVANGWGRIVAVTSPVAVRYSSGVSAYAVGKAAEEALLGTLAVELAGTGVTSNVLQVKTIDAAHERVANPTPKNASWTLPEEIAAAVRYLCGDEAGGVSGAKIPLFGAG